MGEILKFRPRETPAGKTEKPTAPAEIFIFPGVRIERRGFSLADRLYSASKPERVSSQSGHKLKE